MKKQILSLVAVLSMGVSASAADLNGLWKLTDRVCLSETPVNDAFELGRDSLTIHIQDGDYSMSQVINGEAYLSVGQIDQSESHLYFDDFDDTTPPYEMAYGMDSGKLVVYADGFEEGGSCPIGDTLATTLELVR